jgi:hypothetical protein
MTGAFAYHLVLSMEDSQPVSLIAYQDRMHLVDRPTAESVATQYLHSTLPTLPTLETLPEMCLVGARMGWDYGPPRQ